MTFKYILFLIQPRPYIQQAVKDVQCDVGKNVGYRTSNPSALENLCTICHKLFGEPTGYFEEPYLLNVEASESQEHFIF